MNNSSYIFFRLHAAGLLTLCRLVEGGLGPDGGARSRFQLDRSLLTALVDRWRPETHTFHLPCGEMAPTLQDVAYLLGLPLVGEAVGPRVVPPTWLDDLEARFGDVGPSSITRRTGLIFTATSRTIGPRWGLSGAAVRYVCQSYLRSFILIIIFYTIL